MRLFVHAKLTHPKYEIRVLGFLRHAITHFPSFSLDQPPRERERERERERRLKKKKRKKKKKRRKKRKPLGVFGARRCG
jgi:hypothetical protein